MAQTLYRVERSGGRIDALLSGLFHVPSVDLIRMSIAYRPDIDGLRAVAVLSVVGFHAFPAWLPGGFIGVDVFFVISGYLITSIILQGLAKGTFSFADFYARRIRRIFPALLLVLLACLVFGAYTLMPAEFAQLGKHSAAGAGFVANWVLWSEVGYFDNAAETKPLLHLWSLGIEEQFYIVVPVLLWLIWKLRINVFLVLLVAFGASFSWNVFSVADDPVGTFYAPYTRAWELLAGCLLAAWHVPGHRTHVLNRLSDPIAFAAATVLLAGYLVIDTSRPFPGWWALLPVLGAVGLILAGPGAWFNRYVLAHPVAVKIGLISFPLYLWHWPLLSFARILEGEMPGRWVRVGAVVCAFVLAWLTYQVLEKPVRRAVSVWRGVPALVVLLVTVGIAGFTIDLRNGLPDRQVVLLNPAAESGNDGGSGLELLPECGVTEPALKRLFAWCLQDPRGSVRYAVIGDSKAASLFPGLVRTSQPDGRWLIIGGNGPNGVPVPLWSDAPELAHFQPAARTAIMAVAENPAIETVALVTAIRAVFQLSDGVKSGNVATYDYRYIEQLARVEHYQRTLDGLAQAIRILVDAGKQVLLVEDNPVLPNPEDCVERITALPWVNRMFDSGNPSCFVPLRAWQSETILYQQLLRDLLDMFPGTLRVVATQDLLCDVDTGVCGPQHEGRLLYSYTDHISDYAAGRVGTRINTLLQNTTR